ncbi:MAG: hypothetical protein NVS4B1_26940 [Ktedonobacteraceae bacterium]
MTSSLRGIAAAGIVIGRCALYDTSPPLVPDHHIVPENGSLERERLAHPLPLTRTIVDATTAPR